MLRVVVSIGSDDTELVVAVDTIRPPAWSAAGDMLAFQRDLRDLHVTDLAGNVRTVATDVRDPIAWSKTGSRLAFMRASPERSDVVIIDLDRGDETTVTDADDFAWQP